MAEREIDTAIDLLLAGGDPVAIHVLTMAAYDIIEGAARRMKKVTVFVEHIAQLPEDQRDGYRDIIKAPFNFMKHGGGAGETLPDFMPDSTHLFLISAEASFADVYGRETQRALDLWRWVRANEPEIYATAYPFGDDP